MDDVCGSEKINAEVLRNAVEKTFCHVEIVPFLGYNRGKPIGEVSLPSWFGLALEHLVNCFNDCGHSCQNLDYRFKRFEFA